MGDMAESWDRILGEISSILLQKKKNKTNNNKKNFAFSCPRPLAMWTNVDVTNLLHENDTAQY